MEAMLHVKLLVSKHVRFLSAIKILRIIRRDYRIDSNRRFHRGEANGSTAGLLQVLEMRGRKVSPCSLVYDTAARFADVQEVRRMP